MLTHTILVVSFCASMSFVFAGIGGSVNITDFILHRQKRFLIFQDGAHVRLNAGPAIPLDFHDPISWRSFVTIYNFQGGHYNLPTTPLYPWDKWESIFSRSMKSNLKHQEDDSRLLIYTMMENYINRQNTNGRACLLRAICENAQVDHHVGIMAEILNIVLTPGKETLHPIYKEALMAGRSGVDCLHLYSECPKYSSFLDKYLDDF